MIKRRRWWAKKAFNKASARSFRRLKRNEEIFRILLLPWPDYTFPLSTIQPPYLSPKLISTCLPHLARKVFNSFGSRRVCAELITCKVKPSSHVLTTPPTSCTNTKVHSSHSLLLESAVAIDETKTTRRCNESNEKAHTPRRVHHLSITTPPSLSLNPTSPLDPPPTNRPTCPSQPPASSRPTCTPSPRPPGPQPRPSASSAPSPPCAATKPSSNPPTTKPSL
jgi:hypothetical protein